MKKKTVLGYVAPKTSTVPDRKCPYTGTLNVKQELLKGVVVKRDINRTATIERSFTRYVPKYERYTAKRSRLRVHNPLSVDAQIGQEVIVARTRPLSKTKHHVIIQIVNESNKK